MSTENLQENVSHLREEFEQAKKGLLEAEMELKKAEKEQADAESLKTTKVAKRILKHALDHDLLDTPDGWDSDYWHGPWARDYFPREIGTEFDDFLYGVRVAGFYDRKGYDTQCDAADSRAERIMVSVILDKSHVRDLLY